MPIAQNGSNSEERSLCGRVVACVAADSLPPFAMPLERSDAPQKMPVRPMLKRSGISSAI